MKTPTTTHFSVLGLLALRPWSTYELIHYLKGSNVHFFWSKTEARLYQTPGELVSFGFAVASKERISKDPKAKGRQRTVYSITDGGRAALRVWLSTAAQPPSFEIEGLLKLAYGEQGTRADFLDRIQEMQSAIVRTANPGGLASAAESPQLPDRHHLSARMADLTDRVTWVVLEWLADVRSDVEEWDSIETSRERLEEAKAIYRDIAKRVESRARGEREA